MPTSGQRAGFTLLEAVIAAGIFAVAVTATLGLLPSLIRQTTDSADALTAQRLPDNLQVELQRLAAGNFDGLAATVPVMTAPLTGGLAFVADRYGARLHAVTYQPPVAGALIPSDDQYFFIEVWRFSQAPLSYDRTAAVLPLYARVSWPYHTPGGLAPTDAAARGELTFTVSLNR